MRYAFGLVGLLIAVFIMVYIWSLYTGEVSKQAQPAMRKAEQLAGQDEHGVKARDSITLESMERGSKLQSVLVTALMPKGPMEKFYGLKLDDAIIQAGDMNWQGQDGEMAKALILEAYQRKWPLIVVRNGEKIKLPADDDTRPAPTNNTNDSSPLNRQLDGIKGAQKIPTH